MDSDKQPDCCGGCMHWRIPARGRVAGECKAPLPAAAGDDREFLWLMRAGQGTDCPVFVRKARPAPPC